MTQWKIHRDKIDFTLCLGHTAEPGVFCSKSSNCVRHVAIRNHQPNADTNIQPRCCSNAGHDEFISAG
jgi:hypothetical protein